MKTIVNTTKPAIIALLLGVFATLFIHYSVQAQAPGFIGKRFLVGVDFSIAPVWNINAEESYYQSSADSTSFKGSNKDFSGIRFMLLPSVKVEYVLNRVSSIQGFIKFGTAKSPAHYGYVWNADKGSSDQIYPTDRVRSNFLGFGLKYRLSRGNSLNPVGKFMTFGLEYSTETFKPKQGSFLAKNEQNKVYEYDMPSSTQIGSLVVAWGIGKSSTINESLLLNYGIELGIPLIALPGDREIEDVYQKFYYDSGAVRDGFIPAYLFNISIGLSFLP